MEKNINEAIAKMRLNLDKGLGKPRKIEKLQFGTNGKGLQIIRQKGGSVLIAGIACAAVVNRVGEIDSTKLFDDFIYRAKLHNSYPKLVFYHNSSLPFFELGQFVHLQRDRFTYLAVAEVDMSNRLSRMVVNAIEDDKNYWGFSIGYLLDGEPELMRVQDNYFVQVYERGFNHEISILPEAHAASHFTSLSLS